MAEYFRDLHGISLIFYIRATERKGLEWLAQSLSQGEGRGTGVRQLFCDSDDVQLRQVKHDINNSVRMQQAEAVPDRLTRTRYVK